MAPPSYDRLLPGLAIQAARVNKDQSGTTDCDSDLPLSESREETTSLRWHFQ